MYKENSIGKIKSKEEKTTTKASKLSISWYWFLSPAS